MMSLPAIAILIAATASGDRAVPETVAPAASLHAFYAASLRASLFSGFLTLTSFLFATQTFLIVNMKKEIYDHPEYQRRVNERKKIKSSLEFYGPLRRLSALLTAVVCSSLLTSILQLTLGLVPWDSAVIVCLLAAAVTIGLLIWVLVEIRNNLAELFSFLENETAKKTCAPLPAAGGPSSP